MDTSRIELYKREIEVDRPINGIEGLGPTEGEKYDISIGHLVGESKCMGGILMETIYLVKTIQLPILIRENITCYSEELVR